MCVSLRREDFGPCFLSDLPSGLGSILHFQNLFNLFSLELPLDYFDLKWYKYS